MKTTKSTKLNPAPKAADRPVAGPTREQIAALAYAIWEKQGRPEGHDIDHWLLAESQIRQSPRPRV